jgi:hypothetical protein
MDNTNVQDQKLFIARRKRNPDGSITVQAKKFTPEKQKKRIIARGKGEHTIGAVMTSQLVPFRKAMETGLKKRGYNTSNLNFKTVIGLYYNEFASNLYNKSNHFAPVNIFEFTSNPAFRVHPHDNINGELDDIHNTIQFDQVNGIIDNIIDLFRYAKLKKRLAISQGINPKEVLTDEEILQAKAADSVERKLEAKSLGNQSVTNQQLKNILLIGLVMLLIWKIFES